jgi:AraC-like DNA-binding protein
MDFENVRVFRSPPRAPSASLAVVEYGRQDVRAEIKCRALPDYAAVFVENGRGRLVTQDGGAREVVGPALFWLLPERLHTYGPDAGTSWREQWALFRGSMVDEFVAGGLIDAAQPLIRMSRNSSVAHAFGVLHADMLRRDPFGWAAAAATLHALIVRAATQQAMGFAAAADQRLLLIRKRIEARAFSDLDLDRIARDLGMSPATLRRKAAAILGKPPKHHQLQLRIDRAKELLTQTGLSIEAIAARVGYADCFYFSRLFFKRENRSPSQFRKLHARK